MHCKHIQKTLTVPYKISAQSIDQFKEQLKELLELTKEAKGIVYVWRTSSDIPRMKGASPIIYIGKTNGTLHERYISKVSQEAKEYWGRYSHIINNYGPIEIDIYLTANPEYTENSFLYQYHGSFLELPPINLKSYVKSKL